MCLFLPPEIVMHDAYIGGRSENNIKCVVHDDLGRKNRTTRYNCRFSGFTQFHSCGAYSVLSRSPSIHIKLTAVSSLLLSLVPSIIFPHLLRSTAPLGFKFKSFISMSTISFCIFLDQPLCLASHPPQ